jgi:hypothetical protein
MPLVINARRSGTRFRWAAGRSLIAGLDAPDSQDFAGVQTVEGGGAEVCGRRQCRGGRVIEEVSGRRLCALVALGTTELRGCTKNS